MKLSFPLAAAFAAILSLSACGGGGDSGSTTPPVVNNPAALTKTDIAIGTGAEAVNGARVQVNYTGGCTAPPRPTSRAPSSTRRCPASRSPSSSAP